MCFIPTWIWDCQQRENWRTDQLNSHQPPHLVWAFLNSEEPSSSGTPLLAARYYTGINSSTLLRSVVKVARYIKFCQPSRLFWDFVLTLCVALALSGNYEWITTRRGQQCSAEPDKEGVQWTQGNIIIITCKDTCSVYRANTCTYHGISACVSFGRRSTRICRTLG